MKFSTMLLMAALVGCAPSPEEQTPHAALRAMLRDPSAVRDEATVQRLLAELARLSPTEADALRREVDAEVAARDVSMAGGTARSAAQALSARVPVVWSSWPRGSYPNFVGYTRACGPDVDYHLRWNRLPGAFNNPSGLIAETNSVYAYAVARYHGTLLAFDVTRGDAVNICVGLAAVSQIPGLSYSAAGMLRIGYALRVR